VPTPGPSAADKGQPQNAQFGVPLPPGLYTFTDGLRVKFSATHECEYDSMDPCSPFDVVAWFKGRESKVNIFPDKPARLLWHSVQVTDHSLVVRK